MNANTNYVTKEFLFNDQQVRTVVRDGEPWFVGKDVADILGYKNQRDSRRYSGQPKQSCYQRIRSLQPHRCKQAADCKGFQALGDFRGSANYPQARRLYGYGHHRKVSGRS